MWSQAMLKLVFMLIVIIDGETQDPVHFSSIYICSQYSEAIEHQLTSPYSGKRRPHYRLKEGQVNISAYCTPRWVDEAVTVFDH